MHCCNNPCPPNNLPPGDALLYQSQLTDRLAAYQAGLLKPAVKPLPNISATGKWNNNIVSSPTASPMVSPRVELLQRSSSAPRTPALVTPSWLSNKARIVEITVSFVQPGLGW